MYIEKKEKEKKVSLPDLLTPFYIPTPLLDNNYIGY